MSHSLLQPRLLLVALLTLTASPSLAYIGTGAGVWASVVTVAVIGGAFLLLLGLVWFPLKRILKSRKGADTASDRASQKE